MEFWSSRRRRRGLGRRASACVYRRDDAGGHPLRPQQRRVRPEVSARDDGLRRRVVRRRRGRLAGPAARQLDQLARTPGAADRCRRCIETTTAPSSTSLVGRASMCRVLRHRRGRRRLRQRRQGRRLRHGARRQPALPESRRAASSRTSPGRRALPTAASRRARSGSTTTTTASVDLFVAHYVEWSIDKDLFCTLDGKSKSYCTPESYKGQSPSLFRNRGNGTFENVTKPAGIYDTSLEGLGVAMLDFDGDSRMDLFVANDTEPNRPLSQQGQRHVRRTSRSAPASPSARRAWRARAWASTPATTTAQGRPSLIIGNFSNEMMALYHNEGRGLFIDDAPTSAIGRSSLLTLTFGCFFFDYDLDGLPDIFAANGHVSRRHRARAAARHLCAAPASVPQRRRGSSSRSVGAQSGGRCSARSSARAARPTADYDTRRRPRHHRHAPTTARRVSSATTAATATTCCACRRSGRASNRDGIGARVEVTAARWRRGSGRS